MKILSQNSQNLMKKKASYIWGFWTKSHENNFIKEIPLKTNPSKFVEKFQNLKIWLKFAPGNRQVVSRFSKNRPTCGDFDFFFPDPQLHHTFKPIRDLLCTFSYCSVLSIYMIYNIY